MDEPREDAAVDQPIEERTPEPVVATPHDLPAMADEGEPPWWRPTWRELARHMGWRWVLLTPVALLGLLMAATLFLQGLIGATLPFGFHLAWFGGAVGISLAGYLVRTAVRARREPFCIHCGYSLTGLPDRHRCPECGRLYDFRVIDEYRRDPRWFIERWRLSRRMPPKGTPFEAGAVRRRARDGTE